MDQIGMLQAAVATLAGVVVVLFTYQVKEHRDCKRDRLQLRKLYEESLKKLATIEGQFAVYRSVFRKLKISLPEASAAGEEGQA